MTPDLWQATLVAARAGSTDAVGKLLDSFRPYLWVIAQSELRDPLRAKLNGSDLVQESFLNACKAFDRFEGDTPEALQAWLRQILRRVLSNQSRQFDAERRDASLERSIEVSGLPDRAPSPSQRAMSAEQRQSLAQALSELPPHYRELIRLRTEERKSFEEVALLTDRTPDAARMMWGRAVRRLQQLLDEAS